jgi:hypothetical protein
MDDVFVHLTSLPGRVKEAVTQNADGSYSIFIRDDLSREEQLRVYAHARRHIENLDFENRTEKNVQVLEAKAHEED